MAEQKVTISDFSGVIGTTSEKKDIPNAARFVKGMNPFEDPTYLTLSRIATKKSSTTVAGKPYWMKDGSPWSTDRYVYDSAGKIYKVTSADAFSLLRTVSGGAGEGLEVMDDYLYYPLATSLGRYGKLSGTPAFDDDFLSDDTTDLDQSLDTSGNTYTLPTSISEAATARQTFTPTVDPIKTIEVNVDTVGTGDWTLTVHDSNNVLIGSKTIANASMSTGDVKFTFASALRIVPGNDYHFHLTVSTGTSKVVTTTASDLETADFHEYFGILISTDWHPAVKFLNLLAIGNERYIATWDQATYSPNAIVLPAGFAIRSIARTNEFIVAEAYKGSNVRDAEAAERFYWDGISVTFNYSTPITIGANNALGTTKNELVGVYGHRGSVYKGDSLEQEVAKVPKLARGKYVEVYPGAIDEYEGRTLIGYAADTDDTSSFEQGVYEYGNQDSKLPLALNFPYQISTGTTQGANTHITMVAVFGKDIYIGWQDGAATYGVDKIALGDSALASGSWESLIFDGGDTENDLLPFFVKISFVPLTTGQSVTPKYKLDRASSFTNGSTENTVGATDAYVYIHTRCKEIEFGFNVASTSNTFPKITEVKLVYDDLANEGEN